MIGWLFLYHYYEASIGPFRSLSALPAEESEGDPEARGQVYALA
jgi:hypothetical protein